MILKMIKKEVRYPLWVPVFDVRKDRDSAEFNLKLGNGNFSKFIGTSVMAANHDFKQQENKSIAKFYKKKSPETTFKQIDILAKASGGYRKLEL